MVPPEGFAGTAGSTFTHAPDKLRARAVVPPEGFAGTGGSTFTHVLVCRRPLCLVLWALLGGWLPPEQAIQEGETEQLRRKSLHPQPSNLRSGSPAPSITQTAHPGTVWEGTAPPCGGEGAQAEADHHLL